MAIVAVFGLKIVEQLLKESGCLSQVFFSLKFAY